MKAFLIVACALYVCVASQDDKKISQSNTDNEIKIYKRLIPADVLRGKDTLPYVLIYEKF